MLKAVSANWHKKKKKIIEKDTMLPAHERQRLLFYNTMIRSVLHYVSTTWTRCDKQNLGCVLKLRKAAARVISDADNQVSSVKLFNRLQ